MTNTGKAYEEAVTKLHRLFGEDAEISRNQYIEDIFGTKREFDIVIKAKINSYNIVGLIECKDYKRKVNIQTIDSFAKKSESVNANFKVIFSKTGFTKNAIKVAEKYGIKTYSLIGKENEDFSVKVGWPLYGKTYRFQYIAGMIDTAKTLNLSAPLLHTEVFFRKKSLYELAIKEIVKQHVSYDLPLCTYNVSVKVPDSVRRYITIKGNRYALKSAEFNIKIECELREKTILIESPGFYDWNSKKMSAPEGSNLVSEPFRLGDMEEWNEWDECNEIPKNNNLKFILTYCPYPVDAFPEHMGIIGKVTIKKI